MQIRKFQPDKDLKNLETYLRNQYFENKNMSSWLPERLHDLIYRMGVQEADGGRVRSMDYKSCGKKTGKLLPASFLTVKTFI